MRAWLVGAALGLVALGCAEKARPVAEVVVAPQPAASGSARARPSASRGELFDAPADSSVDDPSLPAGTVVVRVADADDAPLRLREVTVETAILPERASAPQVTAKDTAMTDERGVAIFRNLHRAQGEQVLVSTRRGDGVFLSPPFSLGAHGRSVSVHAYETVRDVDNALVGLQSVVMLTIHADAVEVECLYTFYNLGRVAWVPTNVRVGFPPGVSGFSAGDLGHAIRTDDIHADGFTLVGTVVPGHDELQYSYRVPRAAGAAQHLVLAQPPHVAQARVLLEAGAGARLEVEGFPAATPKKSKDGDEYLATEKVSQRSEGGFQRLAITFAGAPR
jgi:hypothetical protein